MLGTPEFLSLPDRRLAYQRQAGTQDKPGLLFLGGFGSDMTGTKASFLAERCAREGYAFLRFDYQGHGQSDGDFKNGTIGEWFSDSLMVFDHLTVGPQIVIGSSMGGWLALMLAAKRPGRTHAFVGIAAAPDFTEELIWMQLSEAQRAQLMHDGYIFDGAGLPDERVPVTLKLIEEGREHLLLQSTIPVHCPVRLLQGMKDNEVPWQYAMRIAAKIMHENVHITYVKDGDHRLSRAEDLGLLWQTVEALYAA